MNSHILLRVCGGRDGWRPQVCGSQPVGGEKEKQWIVGVEDVNFLAARVNCMPLFPREQQISSRFFLHSQKNASLSSTRFQNLYRFAKPTSVICLQNYFLLRMQPYADKQRGALWLWLLAVYFMRRASFYVRADFCLNVLVCNDCTNTLAHTDVKVKEAISLVLFSHTSCKSLELLGCW